MALWNKPGKNSDATSEPRGVSRAVLAGALLDDLCQEVYYSLQRALDGTADRFGVWLAPFPPLNNSIDVESWQGRFWEHGRQDRSEEWTSIGSHFPVPAALAPGGGPVFEDVDLARSGILTGPVAGLRRSLWIPVSADGQLLGALFVASKSPAAQFPLPGLQRLAAELALALAFRAGAANAQRHAADFAATRNILRKICSGNSVDEILQEITSHAFAVVNHAKHPGQFALLGILPEGNANPAAGDLPVEFRWSAGDKLAIRSAISDPTTDIWRKALDTKTVVGHETNHAVLRSAALRIVALPLLVANTSVGVLLAGMHSNAASFATLVRLELFAQLASAALAVPAHKPSARFAEFSRFVLQSSSEPVLLLNARQEIVSANPAAAEFLPHPWAEHGPPEPSGHGASPLPTPVSRVFRPADWLRISAWLQRVTETSVPGESQTLPAELRTGRRARLCAFPLAPGGLFLLLQDSPHHSAESAGAREALELHNLVEWIDQGVLLFDEQESLRAANRRFTLLFGLSPQEVKSATGLRDLVELIAPRVSNPARFAENWWDAARGAEAASPEELRVLQPAPRVIERISHPIRNSAGVRLGRLELYSDLTPQQLSRSKLHKLERLAALGQNVSGVAHELSNPLTTILGYAERLLRNLRDDRHSSEIHRIFSEAERAVSILRQLLASARESPSPRHSVELNPVILRTAELERFRLESENIHLQLDLSPSLPSVLGDAGQIQQILMNLISNARHALLEQKAAGTIFVRTSVNQSARVVVEVSDTGPGIPEAHRHHIFDPFFTTKPAGIGTGLGLSIVMSLVRQNDGNITMHSPPGKGATFLIDFPAVKADVPLFVPELPAALSVIPPAAASGRVLVVEDEPTVAQLIADMLADLGFSADVLQDARRALVSALNREYSLIICDMKMPVLDGQHFYRALAEAGSPLASRFLFVTGDVLGLATQEFLRKHRLPYIAKPFRVEEFSEKVAAVLSQAPAHIFAARGSSQRSQSQESS